MSAYRVIDKLEIVVREGLWMPFGWRAVNSDQVLDLIEKLRSTLPEEAARSKKSSDIAGRAINGQGIPSEGAAGMMAEGDPKKSDAIGRAQARADQIVADAQAAARDIRRGADEYADQVLSSLDANLGRALAAVHKGRQALATSAAASNGKKPPEMSAL